MRTVTNCGRSHRRSTTGKRKHTWRQRVVETKNQMDYLEDNYSGKTREHENECFNKIRKSACRSHAATMGLIYDNSWTKEEENIIREYYPRVGASGTSVLLNRARSACVSRARQLGIIFENTLKWSEEEIGVLRQYYPLEGAKGAERFDGRSASACMNCACRLVLLIRKQNHGCSSNKKNFWTILKVFL